MNERREIWQMTRKEYVEDAYLQLREHTLETARRRFGWRSEAAAKITADLSAKIHTPFLYHGTAIKQAIEEGKPVPANVILEYNEIYAELFAIMAPCAAQRSHRRGNTQRSNDCYTLCLFAE